MPKVEQCTRDTFTLGSSPATCLGEEGEAHLSCAAADDNILCVLGVCLDLDLLAAAGGSHGEAPYLGAVVAAYLLLLRVEAHTLAYQVVAATTPHVEGHLKPDDQDALVQLAGSLSQRMLPSELQSKKLYCYST